MSEQSHASSSKSARHRWGSDCAIRKRTHAQGGAHATRTNVAQANLKQSLILMSWEPTVSNNTFKGNCLSRKASRCSVTLSARRVVLLPYRVVA